MKTFWLSFTDADRPKGQQFLGVAVIDVTDEDAASAKEQLRINHPRTEEGAEWLAAAMKLAWAHRCNPGGAIRFIDITDDPEAVGVPRNHLMLEDELRERELIETAAEAKTLTFYRVSYYEKGSGKSLGFTWHTSQDEAIQAARAVENQRQSIDRIDITPTSDGLLETLKEFASHPLDA